MGKMVPYICVTLIAYILCNDQWILLIFRIQVKKVTKFCLTNGYYQIILTLRVIWRENFHNFILGHTVDAGSIRNFTFFVCLLVCFLLLMLLLLFCFVFFFFFVWYFKRHSFMVYLNLSIVYQITYTLVKMEIIQGLLCVCMDHSLV